MEKKLLLSAVVAFAVLAPIASFTDVLAKLPSSVFLLATRSYWSGVAVRPASLPSVVLLLLGVGPIAACFLLWWFIWVQRNKRQSALAIFARTRDVHHWLERWGAARAEMLPDDLKEAPKQARKLSRRLGRVVAMVDPDNWRPLYVWYLTTFWFRNGPALSAYTDMRPELPVERWPLPEQLTDDRVPSESDTRLVAQAMGYSALFTDGAKAWTGYTFFMHTMVGGVFGLMFAVISGGILTIAMLSASMPRGAPLLAAAGCAVPIGIVAGWTWQCISRIAKRRQSPNGSTAVAASPEAASS